ncbi:MAG TPA: DUF1801 domain-containing protein [Cyclobacteriaceae bacterium]|nr:DUF1801 domain-containing protein [Cyclobacteriaceae bacterium]
MDNVKFKTVDEYIDSFPEAIKTRLKQVRATIKKAAPKAEEAISYNIAGYKQNGVLIYFSGNKKHTGLYPMPAGFEKELKRYASGRSTIKIPHTEPLPLKLIADMVKYKVIKNKEAATAGK